CDMMSSCGGEPCAQEVPEKSKTPGVSGGGLRSGGDVLVGQRIRIGRATAKRWRERRRRARCVNMARVNDGFGGVCQWAKARLDADDTIGEVPLTCHMAP